MSKIFTLLIIIISSIIVHGQTATFELNQNWQFRKLHENNWHKASVPGTVHTDLLANKLIPDPYFSINESKLQWIDTCDWEYRSIFTVDEELFKKQQIEMVFEGLDTYADVYLNGKLILKADNMFRGWVVTVRSLLKKTGNVLRIVFFSAKNKVDSIAKKELPIILPDNPRVYARKAQYHFGWDWGPTFVTCGIWKKIKLEGWNGVRIRPSYAIVENNVKLIQQKDSFGDRKSVV